MAASIADYRERSPFTRRRLTRDARRDFRSSRLQDSSLETYALRASITSTIR